MIEKKLICCEKDVSDKRIQRIFLTEKSSPVIQRLNREVTNINNEVLKDISKEELQQVETTVTKILTRFKERTEVQHEKNNV